MIYNSSTLWYTFLGVHYDNKFVERVHYVAFAGGQAIMGLQCIQCSSNFDFVRKVKYQANSVYLILIYVIWLWVGIWIGNLIVMYHVRSDNKKMHGHIFRRK